MQTLEIPESGEASPVIPDYGAGDGPPEDGVSGTRVGSFEPPERVPEYEVLEERPAETDEVRAVRLLVDTRVRGKAEYELIAQDLKARYAGYDAVTAEFTDAEALLDYNGAALIFNTMQGASYMGFFYGPIDARGYYVRAAE